MAKTPFFSILCFLHFVKSMSHLYSLIFKLYFVTVTGCKWRPKNCCKKLWIPCTDMFFKEICEKDKKFFFSHHKNCSNFQLHCSLSCWELFVIYIYIQCQKLWNFILKAVYWGFKSSGIWCCVSRCIVPNALKDCGAFIFKSQAVQVQIKAPQSFKMSKPLIHYSVTFQKTLIPMS